MAYHHVPATIIDIFNSIYSDFKVTISVNGQSTKPIAVNRGVLRGISARLSCLISASTP
jgi:hypothetical protein